MKVLVIVIANYVWGYMLIQKHVQPHADSSYFTPGQSKEEVYEQVFEQSKGLVEGQRNWV